MLNRTAHLERISIWIVPYLEHLIGNTEFYLKNNSINEELDEALQSVYQALEWIGNAPEKKLRERIKRLCLEAKAEGKASCDPDYLRVYFNTQDYWASEALAGLKIQPAEKMTAWDRLLKCAEKMKQTVPNSKWISEAKACLENLGHEAFKGRILCWMKNTQQLTLEGASDEHVDQLRWAMEAINTIGFKQSFLDLENATKQNGEDPAFFTYIRNHLGNPEAKLFDDEFYKNAVIRYIEALRLHPVRFQDQNTDLLRGLVWFCIFFQDKELIRALSQLCVICFKKIAGVGYLAQKVGNACLLVLGQIASEESMTQLGILRYKLKGRAIQNTVEKTYQKLSSQIGISQGEIDEMTVSDFGMEEVGVLNETLGEIAARVTIIDTSKIELAWIRQDGKELKSPPAAIKEQYKEDVKELKESIQDMQKVLSSQKERIESLYLQKKNWPYLLWRERYLDHPLVGTLARRLLWRFNIGRSIIDGIFFNNQLVDIEGKDFSILLNEQATVEMWHPILYAPKTVLAWRKCLAEMEIRQPFKQAHREIYTITDAERQTRVYSNRYAAHIIKQHQFNALCAARRWKNTLKLMVDDEFPPASISMPAWNLRAEFWTDGIGEEYGQDTNETGTFFYLATDQVRFFESGAVQARGHAYNRGQTATADPFPLENIPAIVFSEVMRDIDLFIGVASVGNDPTWADAGPEGHRNYWYDYSFGELGTQAQARKEVLMSIVPRLAIAGQCTFEGRYLRIEGKLRIYKIHLGSGNILMEPNDQYLCIVRNQSRDMQANLNKVFLPFEGDDTLSLILSKAILLANDSKIQDATILSQIKRV
jgi:hypothetical protein